jgi:hypothetical protein
LNIWTKLGLRVLFCHPARDDLYFASAAGDRPQHTADTRGKPKGVAIANVLHAWLLSNCGDFPTLFFPLQCQAKPAWCASIAEKDRYGPENINLWKGCMGIPHDASLHRAAKLECDSHNQSRAPWCAESTSSMHHVSQPLETLARPSRRIAYHHRQLIMCLVNASFTLYLLSCFPGRFLDLLSKLTQT